MQRQLNDSPTDIYNPTQEDFEFYVADENNVRIKYTLRSQEITTLPHHIAIKGANDLANKVTWERGIQTNFEADKKEVLAEIIV